MRWSASLAALTRREAVLTSALALGAALAALSEPLGAPWLVGAGVFVAAGGAVVRLVIAGFRARLEGRRERSESLRRLRVAVGPVSEIDFTAIGVDPAAQDLLAGEEKPVYMPRQLDRALREALTAAVEGRGRWLVVLVGGSKIGKSRSLLEALQVCQRSCPAAAGLQMAAPVDGDGLRALLLPGQGPQLGSSPAVLWLDDLEPFLNQAVTWQTLREWQAGRPGPGRIVAATYGGKGSDLLVGSSSAAGGGLATVAAQVLAQACEIAMSATTENELDALQRPGGTRRPFSAGERAVVARFGLAAYLVAGPALERKLVTARHSAGGEPCLEGVAVVGAAVDWARCGRTDPVTDELLRQIWPTYLPPGVTGTDEGFETGLAWALRPVAGDIALLYRTGSYTAYDYVVRLVRDRPDAVAPREAVWAAALTTADIDQAATVAIAAYRFARLLDAATAFTSVRNSTVAETAATAGYNLGVVLGDLGRFEDEVAAYQLVITGYGEDPAPALREQTARALFNMGVTLRVLGRYEDAVAAYQQVITGYGEDPAPALREQTATALFNMGVTLGDLGRYEDAVAAYQQVITRYGEDPAPALREAARRAQEALGS